MQNRGYLYVLANSAMPGVVKVGKTTRTPSERAAELSGVTGLPSSFIVVYEQLFSDCGAAESYVHTYLTQKGFRISDNREFFNAPVNDVVRAIVSASTAMDNELQKIRSTEAQVPVENDGAEKTYVWSSIFEEAENNYYGYGEDLKDHPEALRLYQQAAKLGCLPAYLRIGTIFQNVSCDQGKAIAVYKQGAAKGSIPCYWALGELFIHTGNKENAEKCFLNFLRNFPPPADEQRFTMEQREGICRASGYLIHRKLKYGAEYPAILDTFFNGEWAARIRDHTLRTQEYLREVQEIELVDDFTKVIKYLDSLKRLPEKAIAATDSAEVQGKKPGFFARFFS